MTRHREKLSSLMPCRIALSAGGVVAGNEELDDGFEVALLQDGGSALTVASSVLIARESKQFVKGTIFLAIYRTHST
jgi:hypothetical protein